MMRCRTLRGYLKREKSSLKFTCREYNSESLGFQKSFDFTIHIHDLLKSNSHQDFVKSQLSFIKEKQVSYKAGITPFFVYHQPTGLELWVFIIFEEVFLDKHAGEIL